MLLAVFFYSRVEGRGGKAQLDLGVILNNHESRNATGIRLFVNCVEAVRAISDFPDSAWNSRGPNSFDSVEHMTLVSNLSDGACQISQPK